MKPIFRLASVWIGCVISWSAYAQTWPTVPLPDDVQAAALGGDMVVNGQTMRAGVFTSQRTPEELAAWFKAHLGDDVSETPLENKRILSRKVGDFYETIQLENKGLGTRGMVSVMRLADAGQAQAQNHSRLQEILVQMPAGTKVMSDIVFPDKGQTAHYLMLTNEQSMSVNREQLLRWMAKQGYSAEPFNVDAAKVAKTPSQSMMFRGEGKEAIAVISRDAKGRSTMVINTISRTQASR